MTKNDEPRPNIYEVDRASNRIKPLEMKHFSTLQLRERDHLQEWIANMPEVLGEELLIIQKEFDRFENTRERLDLLALDKSGRLVIIENKLDDSGRDVVWQALKYCAYCSSLSKAEIVTIYQNYLDVHYEGGNATQQICDFLDIPEFEDITLNEGNSQRVIFIAAKFRPEVTATVLWLIEQGIQAQCITITPYGQADKLFLDIKQIIPPPEAADYMIKMASKDAEEKSAKVTSQGRYKIRLEFWDFALNIFREKGLTLFQNINPSKDHWLNAGSGLGSCTYTVIFLKTGARVEFILARSSKDENKWLFDQLYSSRDEIDGAFGNKLDWLRLNDKISCRISYGKNFDSFNRETWPEIAAWMATHISKLERAMSPHLSTLSNRLRQQSQFDHTEQEATDAPH